jgi:hypothetical protein
LTEDEIADMARENAQYLVIEKMPTSCRNLCLNVQSRMQKLSDLAKRSGDSFNIKRAAEIREKVNECLEHPENSTLLRAIEIEIDSATDFCTLGRN